jgi:hypothetical protein
MTNTNRPFAVIIRSTLEVLPALVGARPGRAGIEHHLHALELTWGSTLASKKYGVGAIDARTGAVTDITEEFALGPLDSRGELNRAIDVFRNSAHKPEAHRTAAGRVNRLLLAHPVMHDQIPNDVFGLVRAELERPLAKR